MAVDMINMVEINRQKKHYLRSQTFSDTDIKKSERTVEEEEEKKSSEDQDDDASSVDSDLDFEKQMEKANKKDEEEKRKQQEMLRTSLAKDKKKIQRRPVPAYSMQCLAKKD